MSCGEYVSLNKVESIVKLLAFVDMCCIIADSSKSNCICLICPNHKKIVEYLAGDDKAKLEHIESKLALQQTIQDKSAVVKSLLDQDVKLLSKLQAELHQHCVRQGLERFEIPFKLLFVKEVWTPDTGLVTDSLKLKRKMLENFYKHDINLIY